ncbi:unnamed protein product, partial [Schistosoma margrebowiei]
MRCICESNGPVLGDNSPRWLRSTLIPALLNAPEIEHLSDELKFAREQLLQGIRSAGLSHLLNHTKEKTSATKMITKTT